MNPHWYEMNEYCPLVAQQTPIASVVLFYSQLKLNTCNKNNENVVLVYSKATDNNKKHIRLSGQILISWQSLEYNI